MIIRMELKGPPTGECDIKLTNMDNGKVFPTIYQETYDGTCLYAKDIKEILEFCGAKVEEVPVGVPVID